MLQAVAEDVWVHDGSVQMPVGPLHARATIIRRNDGGLIVHSPLAFDNATAAQIDALGPVSSRGTSSV